MENAARALLFANATSMEVPVRFISYNDSISAQAKIALAETFKVRGVAVFKIDGEEDPDLWNLFK
jgi:spore germination protein YaaH